jgi:hypothetical protein
MRQAPVYIALMLLGFPATLHAQVPDAPDTQYSEGGQPTDPEYERSLPQVQRHRAFLPVSIDLSSRMPAVGNQGRLGSCTAWAVGYAARSYYSSALEGRDVHRPANLPSPSYIFHLARADVCEKGSNIPRTIAVLQKGALSLKDYPYSDQCVPPAAPAQVAKATDFRVRGVKRVDLSSIDNIKGQLAQSNPVMFAFADSRAFQQHRGGGVFSEEVPAMPLGGHEMVFVGYDDRRQAFRLINSWGPGWGDHGYAWLSYDLVKSRVKEAYVLDVAPPTPVVPPQIPPPVAKVEPTPAPKPQPVPVPTPTPAHKADLSDLPNLSCAHVTVQNRNGRNDLTGFVGYQADLDLVRQIARNVPKTSAEGVTLAPWPQCEALQTLEKPLAAADSPTLAIDSADMHAGDTLKITVRSPSQISYLYVAYIQADGSVVQLQQPQGVVPAPTLPNQTLVFGDGANNRAKFTIGPPFGPEMIVALASRSPLFDSELPATQTERDFLSALRRALIYKPSTDLPDREVTAAVKTLKTSPR